jgi:hypothetical protein
LIAFNPTTGLKLGPTIYAPGGYDLNDCEPSFHGLLLADRRPTNPGVRYFDVDTNQLIHGPVDVGLPPFDILANDALTDVSGMPSLVTLGQNYPNPFNPETSIPFTLAREARVSLTIYNVSGRLIVTLVDEHRRAGSHVARWDGRDASGNVAPTGVYFVRLQANGIMATSKLALMK